MELKAKFAKVVGTPKEGRDSWVVVEDSFFLLLEILGPPDFPVASRGKEIIETIFADYHNLSQKNLANLKTLVDKIEPEVGVSLSLILGVKLGKVFYLVCRGAGQVFIRRQGKFAPILNQEGSASGIIEDKDVFLLTSPRLAEVVSSEEIKTVFDNLSVAELAESITSLVHRAEDTSGVASLILEFEKIEKEEWEEETPAPVTGGALAGKEEEVGTKIWRHLSSIIYHLKSILQRSSALYLRTPQGEEERQLAEKKRTIFWVALILVILLILSIVFGIGKRQMSQKESRFAQTYELASHQYEEGKALLGLNNVRATTLLQEAKNALSQAKKDFGKGTAEVKKIEELLEKIEQGMEEASQVYKIAPEVFLDLGLIKEGGEGRNFTIYGENLIILDKKVSSLYQVNIKSKSSQILAGGEKIVGATLVALGEDRAYVLTNEGINEIELKTKNLKLKIKKDSDWGEIVDMASFGGNLYLLDKTKSNIWKYIGGEAGFSEKRNYLTGEYNLSNAISMAIDGSVWLTTDRILKFTQGEQDSFDPQAGGQGLTPPLTTNLVIFTSDETKDLYVLDEKNKRIVVLGKDELYKSQYIFEGVGEVSDMVVSEAEKKILLLSGSKIYSLGLK